MTPLNEEKLVYIDGVAYLPDGTANRRAILGECWQCGQTFWHRNLSHLPGKNAVYCSRKCLGLARHKLYASRRPWRRCVVCRTMFKPRKGDVGKPQRTCLKPGCVQEAKAQAARINGLRGGGDKQKRNRKRYNVDKR